MFKIFLLGLMIPLSATAKVNKSELQNLMDLYINQVSRGSFGAIPHTDEFKSILGIDKEKYKDCAKAVCKVKFTKEPSLIDIAGDLTARMNIQVLKGKIVLSEANICYFAIYKNKKPVLNSFASDCDL